MYNWISLQYWEYGSQFLYYNNIYQIKPVSFYGMGLGHRSFIRILF